MKKDIFTKDAYISSPKDSLFEEQEKGLLQTIIGEQGEGIGLILISVLISLLLISMISLHNYPESHPHQQVQGNIEE